MSHAIKENTMGYGGGITRVKAEVVNVKDDPEQSGRAQIRIVGHQQDQAAIPDENLIWARPMGPVTSAGVKGTGTSARLIPGSLVYVEISGGPDAQEYLIMGTLSRGGKDEKSDTNPAVRGVGQTDISPSFIDRLSGYIRDPSSLFTTADARLIADSPRKRDKSKVDQGQKVSPAGGSGVQRAISRFISGDHASIGRNNAFDNAQNARTFIQNRVANRSAVMPDAIKMLDELKKVTGVDNPTAINAVGAKNLFGVMKTLKDLFPKKKNSTTKKEQDEDDRLELLWNKIELAALDEDRNAQT